MSTFSEFIGPGIFGELLTALIANPQLCRGRGTEGEGGAERFTCPSYLPKFGGRESIGEDSVEPLIGALEYVQGFQRFACRLPHPIRHGEGRRG